MGVSIFDLSTKIVLSKEGWELEGSNWNPFNAGRQLIIEQDRINP